MKIKIKKLRGPSVPVIFGPMTDPERYKIDLLKEAFKRSLIHTVDFNKLELEIGHRLGEKPYADTGFAKKGMPLTYLCEGSVWLNFHQPDGSFANISLVPHFHDTRYKDNEPPHHNFWLYWTNFDGSRGSDYHIPGHRIPVIEPVVISIMCGKEIHKGIINIKTKFTRTSYTNR